MARQRYVSLQTQSDVLWAINGLLERHGYSPSYQEIQKLVGLQSKSQVYEAVEKLVTEGLVTRKKGHVRTVRLTPLGKKTLFGEPDES